MDYNNLEFELFNAKIKDSVENIAKMHYHYYKTMYELTEDEELTRYLAANFIYALSNATQGNSTDKGGD